MSQVIEKFIERDEYFFLLLFFPIFFEERGREEEELEDIDRYSFLFNRGYLD